MPIKIPGTYCPLCGDIGLFAVVWDDEVWAYCAQGATGLEDAHTAYVYPKDRLPAEVLEYLDLASDEGGEVREPTEEPADEEPEETAEELVDEEE